MGEHATGDKFVGMRLFVHAAAFDVFQANHRCAQDLAGGRDGETEQIHPTVQTHIMAGRYRWQAEQQQEQKHGEYFVAVVEQPATINNCQGKSAKGHVISPPPGR